MPSINAEMIEKLRDEMRELKGRVRLVTLFGSAAKGRMTPLSDIDIAVLPAQGIDELLLVADVLSIVTKTLGVTEDDVDILLLNRVNSLPLLYEAVGRGLLLYTDLEDYVDYRDKIISLYLDYRVFERKLDLTGRYLKAVERSLSERRKEDGMVEA